MDTRWYGHHYREYAVYLASKCAEEAAKSAKQPVRSLSVPEPAGPKPLPEQAPDVPIADTKCRFGTFNIGNCPEMSHDNNPRRRRFELLQSPR